MSTTEAQPWRAELQFIVDLMRDLSRQSDPQKAAALYGERLREGHIVPSDEFLSVSVRDLKKPQYRITRSTTWKDPVNPWKEKHKLPLFDSGILGELIYSGEPELIENVRERVSPDDPAYEYLRDFQLLVTLPHYDNGVALNMGVILIKDPSTFPRERIPTMVWQSNLWGRSVLSSVLRMELADAYEKLDREFRVVSDIQCSLLPSELPKIPTLRLAASYHTATHAGGDYYDFFTAPGGRHGMLIADVSGHGAPAAVIMAITHAIAHTSPESAATPSRMLSHINDTLSARYTRDTGTFVTAFYAVYDPATRAFTYSSAGHPAPRLVRDGGVIGIDGPSGLPLGIRPGETFPEETVQLQPKDQLLLYTDGIIEAFNPRHDLFGTPRMDAALAHAPSDPGQLIRHVLRALAAYAQSTPAHDDQTLVAITVD